MQFLACLIGLCIALMVLVAFLPKAWFVPLWYGWKLEGLVQHFTTVWSIQATLSALVYPILISFVAVVLQRRAAAEVSMQLYLLDSGALVAGLSSLGLVLVMAIQYLEVINWGVARLHGWLVIDAAWFVLNVALTIYFLFKTVEFLRPDIQKMVAQRYAISMALPRDVARLSAFLVLARAIERGGLSVPSYEGSSAATGPHLSLSTLFREGALQQEISLHRPARLIDVRIWLLKWVVESWHRNALQWAPNDKAERVGVHKPQPLLRLPLVPGTVYESKLGLAYVENGPALTAWQRWLLRTAVVLQPEHRGRTGIRTQAIIEDVAAEARNMVDKADWAGFERAYGELVELHRLLLAASLDKTETGEQGSWAWLPDIEDIFKPALHIQWSMVYRGLFHAAIEGMSKDTDPLERLCYLLQHLDCDALRVSPIEIREHLLQLPQMMFYMLGSWWAGRVEEQGIFDHSHAQSVALRPPFSRAYDKLLATFVAGWECATPIRYAKYQKKAMPSWAACSTEARLITKHIDHTALMLLAAVSRGDRAAAEWLADVLCKWSGSLGFHYEPYPLYGKTAFITIEDLKLAWPDFCMRFGVDANLDLQYDTFLIALRNYWTDIRLLSIELMLDWVWSTPAEADSPSLAFEITAGLLTGKQWKSGGQQVDTLDDLSPPEYLLAKARQFAASGSWREGYIARLDRFVASVKHMERPNMISSRVYSFSGADYVESLQESQLALMAVLATEGWSVPDALQRQMAVWLDPHLELYPCLEVLRGRLKHWIDRLDMQPELPVAHIGWLKGRVRPGIEAQAAIDHVKAGLTEAKQALERLRTEVLVAQPIDEERRLVLARQVSSRGFSKEGGYFPVHLFRVEHTVEPLEDFTINFTQRRRGEFTVMQMEQPASNEGEYFAKVMAQEVARVVLNDILRQSNLKHITAQDADTYWRVLKEEARHITERGEEPILLLGNATSPDWVWDWQHADFVDTYKRPDDLRVRRRDGAGDEYQCSFNDIDVYVAPIPNGQSLLMSSEAFHELTFTDYGEGRYVYAEVVGSDTSKSLVNLKLTFSRRAEAKETRGVRITYA